MENNSYVYAHVNVKDDKIFYIGIGTKKNKKYYRAYSKRNRNKIWNNYINKNEYKVIILNDNLDRDEACRIEIDLIKKYGKIINKTGCLVNVSNGGGESSFGCIRDKEWCKNISKGLRGRVLSDESKQKMRLAKIGRKLTDEHKEKISYGNKGKTVSEESKKKMSDSKKGTKVKITKEESDKRRNRIKLIIKRYKKRVFCFNNNKIYDGMIDAAKELNLSLTKISMVCRGERAHTKGYKFKYTDTN